jgi:hypothetical protein
VVEAKAVVDAIDALPADEGVAAIATDEAQAALATIGRANGNGEAVARVEEAGAA